MDTVSNESQIGRSGANDLNSDLLTPSPEAVTVSLTSIMETIFWISCDIFVNNPNSADEVPSEGGGAEDPTAPVDGENPEVVKGGDELTPSLKTLA